MKSFEITDIELIANINKEIAKLEVDYNEYCKDEKYLVKELNKYQNNSQKFQSVKNKYVNKIIDHLIKEYPLSLFDSDEFDIVNDIKGLLMVLKYSEVLNRSINSLRGIIGNLSKKIIESKKLVWNKLTLTKLEYQIVCEKFKDILIEGELCLDKTDVELYRIIGEFYNKDEDNVKMMIHKHADCVEVLPELIKKRIKTRTQSKKNKFSLLSKTSKQIRK